jgi:hypothetical protein
MRDAGPTCFARLYYLGGTLVFAGLASTSNCLAGLDELQRVLVTLGPGFVAYSSSSRATRISGAATPSHLWRSSCNRRAYSSC